MGDNKLWGLPPRPPLVLHYIYDKRKLNKYVVKCCVGLEVINNTQSDCLSSFKYQNSLRILSALKEKQDPPPLWWTYWWWWDNKGWGSCSRCNTAWSRVRLQALWRSESMVKQSASMSKIWRNVKRRLV